ncbi:Nucleolar protein 16 [Arthrobotrys musiformis]|uniref:Nucleolar protein 16 n=1 Tax=Arthrobotrys musiformis TaxID=47236 RepID=A0AAV9WRQ8_9PEZI
MGRELQKKKNRSSINKVTRRKQNIRKRPQITGSKLVADSWDKKQTLSQNYARLGLTHRLKSATGGKEPSKSQATTNTTAVPHQEARITRSSDGSVKVEYSNNLLYSTLTPSSEQPTVQKAEEEETDLIRALKHRATLSITKERVQSDREEDWVQRLIAKHGDDYQAMFWDKELNIRQQSVGDIKRRIKKWQSKKA